ncbi:carboxylesterase family protein, partial [Staphylococcus simulans]
MGVTVRFDEIENRQSTGKHLLNTVTKLYNTRDVATLSTHQMMNAMEEDVIQYGPSKGLELSYSQGFDETTMRDSIPDKRPVLVGFTEQDGDCYIRNESRKLAPERVLEVMNNNDKTVERAAFSIKTGKSKFE